MGINVAGISRAGFTAIRWCLQRNEISIAQDVAEALYNLPDDNNSFQLDLTLESIEELLLKYPDHPGVSSLKKFVGE